MRTTLCANLAEKKHTRFSIPPPKNLLLLFEWDNLENARQFIKSKELRQAMREAGVCRAKRIKKLPDASKCGEMLAIRVLDHVILGADRYYSFSDRGLL
jgi:hypothetical protein